MRKEVILPFVLVFALAGVADAACLTGPQIELKNFWTVPNKAGKIVYMVDRVVTSVCVYGTHFVGSGSIWQKKRKMGMQKQR